MDMVVKEGCLFLQGVKFGKRVWRKTWVVLFESSAFGIGRLEMYDVRDGRGTPAGGMKAMRKGEKRVIQLADCLSITPAPGESCPAEYVAFYLNTAQRTYTLAGPVRDEWVPKLCHMAFQQTKGRSETGHARQRDGVTTATSIAHNDVYSTWNPGHYRVMVEGSKLATQCRLSGTYLLSPEKEALCLLDIRTGQTVYSWPYCFLRRFGQVKKGVTIEAGRRCQTGEGHFTFLSNQGPQIYRAIEEAIMHQSVQDLLSKATASLQQSTTRQLPPTPRPDDQRIDNSTPKCSVQERPLPVVSRKNLTLPPPPTFAKPAVPRLGPDLSSPPTSPKESLYATIKPHPKPRNRPTPPKVFPLPAVSTPSPVYSTAHSPFQTGQRREQMREAMNSDASASNEDPDLLYCNWRKETEASQDSRECMYSTVVCAPGPRNKCRPDTSTRQAKDNQQPSVRSFPVPVNFKQTPSSILLEDLARTPPPLPPRAYGGSSGCIDDRFGLW